MLDIEKYCFAEAEAGDRLVFNASPRDASISSSRIQLIYVDDNWNWIILTQESADNQSLPITDGIFTYELTADNVDNVKRGIKVKGENFILTSVLLVKENEEEIYIADGAFKTSGTRLLDANDAEFMMRGCNYSWCWQRGHETSVIPAAKRIGCNTIRIQLGDGGQYYRPSRDELEYLIRLCEKNRLIAVFNTHDETGSNSVDDLIRAADFWIEMKDVLNAHLQTVIVNISNEWFGAWNSAGEWAEGYKRVIPMIRDAGIRNTLLVDCAGYGQWPQSLFDKGREVAAADSYNNIMFAIHFYDTAGKDDWSVRSAIDNSLALDVPLIIGEFSYKHMGNNVAYQTIMDYCLEKRVGYLVWSWTGNGGGTEDCDMFATYDDSQYRPNGTATVLGRNGIKETGTECTVFDPKYSQTDVNKINETADYEIDWNSPVEIYDMSGRRVTEMNSGSVYIVRQGPAVRKVII